MSRGYGVEQIPNAKSGRSPKAGGGRREDRTQEGFCFDTSAPDCHRDAALPPSVAERASSEARPAAHASGIGNWPCRIG